MQKEKDALTNALNEHKVEAQSAQKELKEEEICVSAVAAAYAQLQSENAELRFETDGLKQLNIELMQKALSALRK